MLCLLEDRGLAAPAYRSSLMDGNGAKITLPIAAAMSGQGKTDGLQGLDLTLARTGGMDIPFKFQCMYPVQLLVVGAGQGGFWIR